MVPSRYVRMSSLPLLERKHAPVEFRSRSLPDRFPGVFLEFVLPALLATAAGLVMAWVALRTPAFSDYEVEAEPPLRALQRLDLAQFFSSLPAYGGSLVMRSPFAFAPQAWGGGALALYRSMAFPCVLAGVILGVTVWRRALAAGTGVRGCAIALLLCAANPISLRALEIGHPEEILGGVLCVAAALAAGARRPALAGVLLGLAVANKPWAVIAVAPVMLMLPYGRWRAAVFAGGAAGLFLLPLLLAGGAGAVQVHATAMSSGGVIFQPWQVWWYLGDHGHVVMGLYGAKPGFRTPPDWIGQLARPLVVLVPLAICVALGRGFRDRPWHDGLLLLAVALLLRCLLDPWNVVYYEVPFLLALVAWEIHARPGLLPSVSVGATLACWVSLDELPAMVSPDLSAAIFLGWSVSFVLMALRHLHTSRAVRYPETGYAPGTAGGHGTGRDGDSSYLAGRTTSTPMERPRTVSAEVSRTS